LVALLQSVQHIQENFLEYIFMFKKSEV